MTTKIEEFVVNTNIGSFRSANDLKSVLPADIYELMFDT